MALITFRLFVSSDKFLVVDFPLAIKVAVADAVGYHDPFLVILCTVRLDAISKIDEMANDILMAQSLILCASGALVARLEGQILSTTRDLNRADAVVLNLS